MQFTLELNNKITDLHDHFGKEVEEFKEALSTKMINVTNYVSKVEERLKKNQTQLEEKIEESIGI